MIKALGTKYNGKNSSILNLRLIITCLLGFAGFLRVEGLFNVKLKHIKLHKSDIEY